MARSLGTELDQLLLTGNRALIACAVISASLLGGAFLFEYVGGLPPCKMCIWQRWAHAAVILFALAGILGAPRRLATGLMLAAAIASVGIASYHAGVEWGLWLGPQGCTASLSSNLSSAALVDDLLATPVVRCDEVPWSLLGLSMAGWNALISIDIVFISGWAFWRYQRPLAEV